MRREKSEEKIENRPNTVICGRQSNGIAQILSQLGDWVEVEKDDEYDLRCLFCGSFEDLRGHVDSRKKSEIFYLCRTCCRELHGREKWEER